MLLVAAGYIPFGQGRKLLSDRKQNLGMRAAMRKAGEQLKRAEHADAI